MQRDLYNTVTLATLIPAHPENNEGRAFVPVENTDEDGRPEISYTLKPVRKFTNADLQRDKRGAQTLKHVPKYKQLLTLIEGLRAERDGDEVAARSAYVEYAKLQGWPSHESFVRQMTEDNPRATRELIEHRICNQAEPVRFVIWECDGRLAPGLFCPDISTAFFVHAVMSALGSNANVGARLCPKCGQPFLQKRSDQSYCSIRCREAHRVARFRARKKVDSVRKRRAGGKK